MCRLCRSDELPFCRDYGVQKDCPVPLPRWESMPLIVEDDAGMQYDVGAGRHEAFSTGIWTRTA